MSIAVLIAVEEYEADDIEGVRFAARDVERLSLAFAALGCDASGPTLLVSRGATKLAVEAALRHAAGSAAANDALYVYYAGRGFSQGGANFLTCFDTKTSDLTATSIALEWVFGLLAESGCQKVVMFLDSCHRGALGGANGGAIGGDGSSGVPGVRADQELEEFFGEAPDRVCLAPCQSGQVSWVSRRNQHGAWALSVMEAMGGGASGALLDGRLLTSRSLQGYLASAVQKTLRGDFVERRDQDPWACGSVSDELLLADFGGVLSSRQVAAEALEPQVPRLVFCGEARQPIKRLSGFKKHQRVPAESSRYAEELVREAAGQEIHDDLERVYRLLRDEFDLRRRDLEKVGPEDGGGSIVCPFFTYHVSVAQDPGHPAGVTFHREIGDISEPEKVLAGAFQSVFGGAFSSLRFTPPVRVDLAGFIERMEGLGEDVQSLDYDSGGSHCGLRLRGVEALIEVTETDILLTHDRSREPRVLVEAFATSQRFLLETQDVRLLSFES